MTGQRPRQPQDDIPYEIWMKHIIKAYRKDIVRLEQLQKYAEGLEEENVALQKKLEQQAVDKETSRKRKETIYELKRIVKSQEVYIGRLQLLLAELIYLIIIKLLLTNWKRLV